MEIELSRRALRLAIAAATGVVVVLGVAAELTAHLAPGAVRRDLLTLLSLSFEGNLPTWYASTILALCGGLLALIAVGARADRPRWWLLSAGFFYISFDESVGIHEAVDALFENTGGLFYFGWVIPAAAIVALLGVLYLPFLRRLPAPSRRRFLVAGILYVLGALVLELPLGVWTERAGPDNLIYAAIDLCEESLELIGASLFLVALVDHLAAPGDALTIRVGAGVGADDRPEARPDARPDARADPSDR
ncbi:MAG: hypothetical protein H6711_16820 [Myxococcales bacterium]|nr:hypothetical protein [Myxococcales bacterium]